MVRWYVDSSPSINDRLDAADAGHPDAIAVPPGPRGLTIGRMLRSILDHADDSTRVGEADGEGAEFVGAIATGVRTTSTEGRDVLDARRRTYAKWVHRVGAGGFVVVDEDDADSEILGAVNLGARRVSIGLDRPADLRGTVGISEGGWVSLAIEGMGLDAIVTLGRGAAGLSLAALAAAAGARASGVDEAAIVAGLEAANFIGDRDSEPVQMTIPLAGPHGVRGRMIADRSGRRRLA